MSENLNFPRDVRRVKFSLLQIIDSISHRFNLDWRNRTPGFLHKPLDLTDKF
jgi:hypothetical protein